MSHKLEVKNLYKTFDNKKILNNISFYINQGEFVSVLGPSGCGKTTLLRIIIGLEKSDEGTVTVDGTDVTSFSPSKRKMGIVFQNYALFENMTVLRNVEYALLCAKNGKKQAREISMALIEQMHLSDKINKYPSELSGGQAQRVAIARTLALSPEIILFDEPLSALDVSTRLEMRSELKELQASLKTTILYVTHDQEEAVALSDRVMVMSEGVIRAIDTPYNIVNCQTDEFVNEFVKKNIQIKAESLKRFIN